MCLSKLHCVSYTPNSIESNMVDIIYDTLLHNTNYPRFKINNVMDTWVNSKEGTITFKYRLDETFTNKVCRIKPKILNVTMKIIINK